MKRPLIPLAVTILAASASYAQDSTTSPAATNPTPEAPASTAEVASEAPPEKALAPALSDTAEATSEKQPNDMTLDAQLANYLEERAKRLRDESADAPVQDNADAAAKSQKISRARSYEIVLQVIKTDGDVPVEDRLEALETIENELVAAKRADDGDPSKEVIPWLERAQSRLKGPRFAPTDETREKKDIELRSGTLSYGLTLSLLRFRSSRAQDEPGRFRNYEPEFEFIPGEVGFQFVFKPSSRPWRLRTLDRKPFQLLSAGGLLLAGVDSQQPNRGNLSLAATLSAFDDTIGLGIGVDLYRGIPVQGADGVAGSETAYTGLLAWTAVREGELTPENFFFVVTLGLQPIVERFTKEIQ